MNRVEVSKRIHGLDGMQVCAVPGATDEEILWVCNIQNPSGVTPWSSVCRDDKEHPQCNPVPCDKYANRVHFLVYC